MYSGTLDKTGLRVSLSLFSDVRFAGKSLAEICQELGELQAQTQSMAGLAGYTQDGHQSATNQFISSPSVLLTEEDGYGVSLMLTLIVSTNYFSFPLC